ncbi:TRAP transporter permease [Alkalihalobacterium alkalinitrilicum]|uniref:TRAP transporter permease n=1 Tax=Alkalihalobacterium alkalinitrilicum TaxID=427920 RepID=UPI000995739D|nr:TRAP transporter fused permease subunit [Alkalihalobacterium alkalinitrilicum]
MLKKYLGFASIIAVFWSLFQLYQAGVDPLSAQVQRAIHVSFALALTFALVRRGENSRILFVRYFDYLLVFFALFSGAYVYKEAERIQSRIAFVSELTMIDYTVCIVIVLMVLEASRRTVGKAMTLLAAFFLIYAFAGPYFPGMLQHSGLSLKRMIETMYFSVEGVLGVPIGVATDYVFYFVLFAAFLELSGGGKLFIDLSLKATNRLRGGSSKAAIFASGGMGTISGSAVANVASTGVFTIPLMKKGGYSPKFSASIEALASTGGQLLPPIMGAAAFIMADTLGIPYTQIALAALIPAILYYAGLYVMVDLQAKKLGITANKELDAKKESIVNKLHLLLPLVLLLFLIFSGKTLQLSAFWAIVAVVAVSYFRKSTRMGPTAVLDALISVAKQAIQVSIPCAVAGIVVGVITHSGLGLKLSSLIVSLSLGISLLAVI